MTEVLEETEQAVQPGEEQIEDKAGDTQEVDTAATEEEKGNGFSIEDIGSDAVKTDEEVLGVSEKAQDRINNKIGNAIKERNIAQEEARKAKARIAELEAEKAIPTEKPVVPLERNFVEDEEYQAAMDKYQSDIIAYNAAVNKANSQKSEAESRVAANDNRLLAQMDELQKRFPNINVSDTISSVADVNGFGNAAPYISDSEHNARIALFLAKNPSELTRIASLTDAAIINREIGKLEERFSNVRKKTTSAPKALDTVKGEASTVIKSIYDIKDNSEFRKARNAEMRAKKS